MHAVTDRNEMESGPTGTHAAGTFVALCGYALMIAISIAGLAVLTLSVLA